MLKFNLISFKQTYFFIIIGLLVQVRFFKIDTWENHKHITNEEWHNRLARDWTNTINSEAYRCHVFRLSEESVKKFASTVEEEKNNKFSFLNVIWNFLGPYNALYDLKDFQITLRNYFFADVRRIQQFEEKPEVHSIFDESLDQSILNLSDALTFSQTQTDFITKIDNARFSELEPRIAKINVNYVGLGRLMADLLFRKQFVCFSIPDLSLFFFKLFYYNIIHQKYLLRVYKGFYEGLLTPQADERETEVRESLMRRFYGFNLKLFLHFDTDFAENLIKLFVNSDRKQEREDLVTNFANLYNFLLKTIRSFEVKQKGELEAYVKKFLNGDTKAIAKFGKRASLLLSIYTFNYLKGMAISTLLPPPLTVMVDHHLSNVWNSVTGSLETFLGDEKNEEVVEYFKTNIKNKEVYIPLEDVRNFAKRIEEKVTTCSKCDMCQVNALFNDFFLFDKANRSPRIAQKLII